MALHRSHQGQAPAHVREGVLVLTFKVILRRDNGRFVKETSRSSRYAAKKVAARWEDAHDETYYVEIVPEIVEAP